MVKLNLGCGGRTLKGYKNIDIEPREGVEVMDLREKLPFEDKTVQKIFSSHFIEHIDYMKVGEVLKDWGRVLVPGGELEVWTPDFDRIVAEPRKKWKWVNWRLYARDDKKEGCIHRCVFNFGWMEKILKGDVFEKIERIPLKEFPFDCHQDCNMGIRAIKRMNK